MAEVHRWLMDCRKASRQESAAFHVRCTLRLDVSAAKLDAPPGLISESPVFLFSGLASSFVGFLRFLDVSQFLLHHLWPTCLVQLLLGTPPCVVQFQRSLGILSYVRTCPECPGVCTYLFGATGQLILWLDRWSLRRTLDCHIPRAANTQVQELQVPSATALKTSHTTCPHCSCWRQQEKFIGAVKVARLSWAAPVCSCRCCCSSSCDCAIGALGMSPVMLGGVTRNLG